MKVSILGPTNMKEFSTLTEKTLQDIAKIAEEIGKTLAKNDCEVVCVFNYSGMLRLIGEAYKKEGGKLEMLYTENDHDWDTEPYLKHLKEASYTTKKESWHDILLSLVKDSDIVICAGLSAGVFAELGYMKWNYQENKGRVKIIVGIKELLRDEEFPPEISFEMDKFIRVVSFSELYSIIREHS